MIPQSEIEQGSDICPSCKSDSWKSARLVVMEGTTNTTGKLDGTATDPGRLSGGVRNFLLSDRWFSWDYPIEGDIGLTSSTGLVEEVKRLMVAHSSKVKMPSPPKKHGIGVAEAWNSAFESPLPKTIREKPEVPTELSLVNSKTDKYIFSLVVMLVIVALLYGLFNLNGYIAIFIIFFSGIALSEWYRRKLFDSEGNKIELAEKLSEYEREEEVRRAAEDLYEKQVEEYEAEKNNVMKARELLWERARVCMRCGTAYLGSG